MAIARLSAALRRYRAPGSSDARRIPYAADGHGLLPRGHSPALSRQQRRRRRFPRDAALPQIGSVHIGRHHRRPGHIHPDVLRLAHRQHRSLVHSLLRMHMACHGIISRKSAATITRPVFQGNNDHRAGIPDPRHIYDGDCGLNQPHILYFHGIS